MGYLLEKGESADFIYSVDYRSLKQDEEEEYFDFFSSSGWSYVASDGEIHLFRAKPGTKPIYTDEDTSVEKYAHLSSSLNKLIVPFVLMTVLAWIGVVFSSGLFKNILLFVAMILSVIAAPAAWTLIATYSNKWMVEGKKRLVILVKMTPVLLLIMAVIALILLEGERNILSILSFVMIGAIGGPMVIWIIKSLQQKMEGFKWKSM